MPAVTLVGANRSAFTQVASVETSTTILAANGNRVGAVITNTDTAILYLRLDGGTVTAANHSVQIAANGRYEVPYQFSGLITGIWAGSSGSGHANVTEFTI
jgi:hypothetical protein